MVEEGSNYLCITRPRRFGKTVMANMIAAFFSQRCDSNDIFQNLEIHQNKEYNKYINKYMVIHIMFNDLPRNCNSYEQYINRIEEIIIKDLKIIVLKKSSKRSTIYFTCLYDWNSSNCEIF